MEDSLYFQYWGKADRSANDGSPSFHLLPYHCLDVSAVATIWWQESRFLQQGFSMQSGLPEDQCLPWILFFVSLHDLGKIDLRFQMKSPETVDLLQSDLVVAFDQMLKSQAKK